MRLLCIANPSAYRHTVTDIPLSYARLAAHPMIDLYHADTSAMLAPADKIAAVAVPTDFNADDFTRLAEQPTELFTPDHFDVAFCRTLKPFPNGYLGRLQHWSRQLLFVNDPGGIAQQLRPQFFVNAARDFTPPTVLTTQAATALQFLTRYGTIVAKRSNSCGGRGVFRLRRTANGQFSCDNIVQGSRQFADFSALFLQLSQGEPLLLMRYLPRVLEGDRRLVVVDGDIIGSYLRRSSDQHWVQNVSTGGSCQRQTVSAADRQLVAATCPHYQRAGIHILGYDLLRDDDGDWLISEINAGNIGGLFRLETMGVAEVTEHVVRWLQHFAQRWTLPQ